MHASSHFYYSRFLEFFQWRPALFHGLSLLYAYILPSEREARALEPGSTEPYNANPHLLLLLLYLHLRHHLCNLRLSLAPIPILLLLLLYSFCTLSTPSFLSLSLRFPFPSPSFLPPSYPRSSARNRPIPMTMMTLQNREREGGRDAMTGVASASTMTRLWMSSRRTMTGARGCRANGELPMMTVE